MPNGPDLLLLATELAGLGGPDLPVEVSAVDSFQVVTDPSVRTLTVVARVSVGMWQVYMGEENALRRAGALPRGEPVPARVGTGVDRRRVTTPGRCRR